MAILKGNIEFTGSIGNLSAYKMRGSEKTILRTKGGADKKKILKSPSFKLTRENFTEFSGCAKLAGCIRRSMLVMAPLADYNYTPFLSSLAKTIQTLDLESKRGERKILLSKHRNLLTGFSLNKKTSFESIVRHPVTCQIDRNSVKAIIKLPELMPGVNLITGKQYPLFRFIVNLACVADPVFRLKGYFIQEPGSSHVYTNWYHSSQLFNAMELIVQLKDSTTLKDDKTLILSLGLQMGMPVSDSVINPVKYAGCARIMAVG